MLLRIRFFLALDGRAISMVVSCLDGTGTENDQSFCRANGTPVPANTASNSNAGTYRIAKLSRRAENLSGCGTARSQDRGHARRGGPVCPPSVGADLCVRPADGRILGADTWV